MKDFHRKRHREDDRHLSVDMPKRNEHEQRRKTDHESRPVSFVFPLNFAYFLVFFFCNGLINIEVEALLYNLEL